MKVEVQHFPTSPSKISQRISFGRRESHSTWSYIYSGRTLNKCYCDAIGTIMRQFVVKVNVDANFKHWTPVNIGKHSKLFQAMFSGRILQEKQYPREHCDQHRPSRLLESAAYFSWKSCSSRQRRRTQQDFSTTKGTDATDMICGTKFRCITGIPERHFGRITGITQ